MKRKITMLFLGLMLSQTAIFSQRDAVVGIPNERAYIHFNTATLLAGETLYYTLYCLNTTTQKLSTLSKVAYVELVGEDKKVVFKHKLKLNNGIGQGDFKIPAEVASGNYKIIGYTQWMRNGENTNLFYNNIAILNPYSANQDVFLQKNKITFVSDTLVEQRKLETVTSQFLKINLKQKKFKKRTKVSFALTRSTTQNNKGNYSVSVRKIDEIDLLQQKQMPSTSFKKGHSANVISSLNAVVFLPELRGEIVSGVVLNKKNNKPVSNEKVSLSIQQKDFILKISTTNNKGRFYFNLMEDYTNKNAIVQVLNKNNNAYKIVLDKHKSVSVNGLNFGKFKISKKYNASILERSIYNQIENSYLSVKQDHVKNIAKITPFFGAYDIVFNLDDFTRFSTLKETFVEIIKKASFVKKNNDEYGFYVESLDPYVKNKEQVAVIVDGILLQKYSKLIEYNARKIKKISIARTTTKFVIGTKQYEGFIVIETFKGDFKKELTPDYFIDVELFKPQALKKYFKRTYTSKTIKGMNRVPDYRTQLLWEPKITMKTQNVTVDFFTSDNIGTYEISIEGFTENGNPVSLKEYIVVE